MAVRNWQAAFQSGDSLPPQMVDWLNGLEDDVAGLVSALGLKAWTFHPSLPAFAATQANTHLAAVYFGKNTVITNLSVPVTSAGVSVTFAALGVYDGNLNLVANTASNPTAFQSTGWIELPLSSPYTVPADGLYYLASGFTAATTLPSVLNYQQNSAVVGGTLPGGKYLGVHAQVPSSALPNPAVSQSTFTNMPLIVAR